MSGLSIGDPITLASVLDSSHVLPGDTLLLREGTYTGDWVINIGGSDELPVIIKPYNGESVTIDGTLTFGKPNVHIYDLEITSSDPDTSIIDTSITMNYKDCWLIGCYIHALHGSGVNWMGSGVGRIAECWIEENGYYIGAEGHGHGIYSHNHAGGTREIIRNLFGNSRGKYTIHIYSGGSNYLKDFVCQDNVIFGDPVHTGGGLGLIDFLYQRNIQYGDYCQQGRYGYSHQNINGQILDNLFFNLSSYSVNADCTYEWSNLTESGNEVYGGEPSSRAGYNWQAYPQNWSQFIPFSLSERWSGIQASITNGVFDASIVSI